MLSVAEDHSCLLNYSVLLVPSAEPHAVPGTVQLLQVLMEMEMGVMQLPLFHGWKPWAVVLWCSGQWTLLHAVGSIGLHSGYDPVTRMQIQPLGSKCFLFLLM
ncbi:hypothetical protein Nepgr_022879 [Nepenthes gracilis]|uniref:Uncharacterized protein n=1 Tax=Nepenthes gracilis TaxID=150966 RepID=A0AAD3T1P2_NEPGR|nr:hypothetical protein Nepgr_022879 [Nepenthes gracilis]